MLADVLGAAHLGVEVPQNGAQLPLFFGFGQKLGVDLGVATVHGVPLVLVCRRLRAENSEP
jgi:hypothetical protein